MAEPFIAEIKMFGGNFAPRGYALCSGQLLSIAQNTALFSLLGTTYGGDGQTTFGLPDMRGRVPIGQGQGPGLSSRVMGELAGSETVTLISSEMPAHTHTHSAGAVTGPGTQAGPAGARMAESTARDNVYSTAAADTAMAPDTIGISGGSQPHNNMQPYLCVNFIIALEGIFPSRN
jgi:microcystin-dependent protein